MRTRGAVILLAVLMLSCTSEHPPVEDLTTNQPVPNYRMQSIAGTRDGDRLAAQATFSDGRQTLTLDLRFAVGSPTRLESGNWTWPRDGRTLAGVVTERSITFLGGQNGPPSLGARLDLLAAGVPKYRVTIPLTELKPRR